MIINQHEREENEIIYFTLIHFMGKSSPIFIYQLELVPSFTKTSHQRFLCFPKNLRVCVQQTFAMSDITEKRDVMVVTVDQ